MSQSYPQETKSWYKWAADLFAKNLKQARQETCEHESKETLTPESWRCLLCGIEGGIVPPGPTTEGYTYEAKNTIPAVISDLAAEMSTRLGQTIAALSEATGDGTPNVSNYADFVSMTDLMGGTVMADPIMYQPGTTSASFRFSDGGMINQPQPDPLLTSAKQKTAQERLAQQEANDRRRKAMEDAARAAAAAFDAGIEAENNPVKLDSDRKLKAI